jgi:hypothetical protein
VRTAVGVAVGVAAAWTKSWATLLSSTTPQSVRYLLTTVLCQKRWVCPG